MKKFYFALSILILLVPLACIAYAHGTGYKNSEFRAITLEFFYSTGEKMSYREARVFSPTDNKFAAQTGRTDEQGRFAFIPDVSGDWRVVVKDEEGHQCEAKINVTQEFLTNKEILKTESSLPTKNELFMRAILGVSLIFNLAFIIRSKNHAH